MNNRPFDAGPFFLLRTPLLPARLGWKDIDAVGEAGHDIDQVLSAPLFREALFLSSESLSDKLVQADETDQRFDISIRRYRRRMATRCTPFGTSAAVSVGEVGDETAVGLGGPTGTRRVCRLDQGVVQTLLDRARASVDLEGPGLATATVAVNASVWLAPDGYRFVELVTEGGLKRHRLSRILPSPAIDKAVEVTGASGTSFTSASAALAEALGASPTSAKAFILHLVQEQLLVLGPLATACTDNAVVRLMDELEAEPWAAEAVNALRDSLATLTEVGDDPVANIAAYRRLSDRLKADGVVAESGRLVHVDLRRDGATAQLSQRAVDRLADALWKARALITRRGNPMAAFANEFVARYGDGEVPLIEALDDDFGVRFGAYGAAVGPLIAPLGLGGPGAAGATSHEPLDTILSRRIAGGGDEAPPVIDLTDYAAQAAEAAVAPFAPSFSVIGSFHGPDLQAWEAGEGQFETKIIHSPAMALFGRFCVDSPRLLTHVRAFISEHEPERPDIVYAEVAHLPHGRVGNVALRPAVRDFEITYLSASEKTSAFEIPASDLWVRVVEGEVQLFSKRLGKRVLPRLTTAHNYDSPASLPIYRFLGALQKQSLGETGWAWGPAFATLPFLPRVVCGPLILARARWRLLRKDVEPGAAGLRAHLQARGLPAKVSLRAGDNVLELRLDDDGDLDLLLDELRRSETLDLDEAFDDENLVADDQGELYRQEFMIPFVQPVKPPANASESSQLTPDPGPAHAPGGRWLYAQIFAGPTTVDELARTLFPAFAAMVADCGGDRPFFIRYNEGGMHIRIRARFRTAADQARAVELLNEMLAPRVQARSIHKVRFDTYFPEYNRYGGHALIDVYESLFSIDSLAASEGLGIISRSADQEGMRWRFGAMSLRRLISDLLPDPKQGVATAARMAAAYAAEFSLSKAQNTALKDTYRFYKSFFEAVARDQPMDDVVLEELRAVLDRRSERLAPLMLRLRGEQEPAAFIRSVESALHMAANRVFLESARAHELVLFAALEKALLSMAARERHAAPAPALVE